MDKHDEDEPQTTRIIIYPNHSLSRTGALTSLLIISILCIGVALIFVVRGAWPVLPFAGLEMLVLGLGLYLSFRQGRQREVIDIDEHFVTILRGFSGHEKRVHQFQRHWLSLEMRQQGWYPYQLILFSHGKEIEIARSLIDEEKEKLAEELRLRLLDKAQAEAAILSYSNGLHPKARFEA